ncbi:bifunctional diguanylate cyclase/phosphodiesterase [Pseudaeromonas paramecii]|uniref:Bifunctional diguanylate cyclase/phosphodiesterase n=2 Tax=Pseudaeromonas paramecii TaxID=2138166 RepID=A0ABP8PZW7_9GAMM
MQAELERILANRQIQTLLQPIFDCQQQSPLGYEALSRGPSDSPLHSPLELFFQAEQQGRLKEMELLCLQQALSCFVQQRLPGRLFVNLSPRVLLACQVPELVALTQTAGLSCQDLVIELTEHHPVNCWEDIQSQVALLKQAGFGVAIDDLGAGNSGLRLWSSLKPDFVKLDIYFTADLDKDLTKRQFVASLRDLAGNLGCAMILEGVEREEEYQCLRQLGIRYCQGYLLGKPAQRPGALFGARSDPAPSEQEVIHKVGQLAQSAPVLSPDLLCEQALQLFKQQSEYGCLPVLGKDDKPIGLLRRQSLLSHLAERFGHSLYAKAPVSRLMDTQPILVEAEQSLIQVSQQLVAKNSDEMDAWFVICQQGRYLGMGRIRELMRRLTDYKLQMARHANPLTLLPGNVPIQQALTRAIHRGRPFWLAYCDLNHFKPFNDVCGYDRGDQMIKLLARLLRKHFTQADTFIGHLGGDDFILLGEHGDWRSNLAQLQAEFHQLRICCYRQEDVRRGGIVGQDRDGQERQFPLVALAIGAVCWQPGLPLTQGQLSERLSQAKKQAKQQADHLWLETPQQTGICA